MKTIEELYKDKNKRSIVNILRKKYGNMELAYLKESEAEEKNCLYCGKKSNFLSIFKGYAEICNSEECKRKYFLEKNIEASNKRKNANKILLVCNVCETNKVLSQNTNKIKNKSVICDSDFCKRNKDRSFLLEKHRIFNFNYNDLSYMNTLIYSLMSLYGGDRNKVRRVLNKNFLIEGIEDSREYLKHQTIKDLLCLNFSSQNFEKTKDDLYYICLNKKNKEEILKSLYGEELDSYMSKYYPENFSTCSICGKKYRVKNIFSKMKKSKYTCSIDCYRQNFRFYMTEDRRKKQSNSIKNKIENGNFTPNIFNSLTGKNIELRKNDEIIKFRSSWEVLFYVMNDGYEYEKFRLPYFYNGKERIYLVDFINEKKNSIVEIKPKSKKEDDRNKIKFESLLNWCNLNSYKMSIVTEDELRKYSYESFLLKIKEKKYDIDKDTLNKIQKFIG